MPRLAEPEPIDLARQADFSLGAVRVKPASREVIIDGRLEIFEPRVLQVLVALAQRHGDVVSRDELSARCWDGRVVGEDALTRCITRIRRLSQASGEFTIETIPRVGYRLTAKEATAPGPVGSQPPPLPAPTRQRWARFQRPALFAALIVLFGVTATTTYFAMRNSRAIEVSLDEHAVIVVPFKGLNEDPDSQHFAESISASITHVLSRSGKRVISPAKAEKFRGAERARVIEESGARFIVDGEIRREGNVIRALVRVDDGRTGRSLISKDFESDTASASALADRIAGYIAARSYFFSLRAIHSNHPETDDAWFRMVELTNTGESRAAFELSKDMARKYPDDAQALSMLSFQSAFGFWWLPQDELAPTIRAGRAAANRVSELAPSFGDNYFALSMLVPPQRWAQREKFLRQGLDIEPTAGPGIVLARLLSQVGRLHAAGSLAEGAVGRDPFNPHKIIENFTIQRLLGNQAAADALNRTGERYWPGELGFAWERFMTSDFRSEATEPASMMRDPKLAAMLEPDGQPPYIRQVLRALASRQPADIDAATKGCSSGWVNHQTTVACLLGLSELGRLDEAFLYASVIFSDMRVSTPEAEDEQWMRRKIPFFDTTVLYRAETLPMRSDARFVALIDGIGLLDYWRAGNPPDFCETERVPVCEALRKNFGK